MQQRIPVAEVGEHVGNIVRRTHAEAMAKYGTDDKPDLLFGVSSLLPPSAFRDVHIRSTAHGRRQHG